MSIPFVLLAWPDIHLFANPLLAQSLGSPDAGKLNRHSGEDVEMDVDEGFAGAGQHFVIIAQAAVAVKPST